uniref:Uncharacterized protein n=1 Tax=viral metagenome TaxID=1070528 RepID=A0A6C0EII9_9ZZZZ
METEDIWEKIIVPLIIGPIFIIIKVLYDRWDFKKTQSKILLNKIKLEKITNKLEKFYWPLYILLINDYDLWSKVKFDENNIEITESASESEIDNIDMEYHFCLFSRKEGDTTIKCSNPVAINCIDKYGAYCIKHQQFKSLKALENWSVVYNKVKLITTNKETNIVDYDSVKNECTKIDVEQLENKIMKRSRSYKKSVDNIHLDILNRENVDTASKSSSLSMEGLIDRENDDKNEIDIKSKMLDELLATIQENHTKIAKIITENIYIAEPKSLMGKQLMKFIKFINIFKSEIDSDMELINPCNYGAGYPKKLLPLVERQVFKLQKQYNELINNFYNY